MASKEKNGQGAETGTSAPAALPGTLEPVLAAIAQARLGLAPNRSQQVLLVVLLLLLLLVTAVPPWTAHVEGARIFAGFYPLLGENAQTVLHTGSAPLSVDRSLWLQLFAYLLAAGLVGYGALAFTREDWAELISRSLAEQLRPAPKAAPRQRTRRYRKGDWSLARVRPGEADGPVSGTLLERMIVRRAARFVADGRPGDALRLLERSLELSLHRHGQRHLFTAELHIRLANLLRDRGEHVPAEEHYLEGIRLREELLSTNDPAVISALASYTRLMTEAGREDVASRLHQLAQAARETTRRPVEGAQRVQGDTRVPHGLQQSLFDNLESTVGRGGVLAAMKQERAN
jgi:hypothetical protein